MAFLKRQCDGLGLQFAEYHPANERNPVVTMTWTGQEPKLPAILLNSHMDVVPVYPDMWTHPSFGADMDAQGRIYARGAQDMKSVGMQYLAVIRRLKREGVRLRRTLVVVFVPDEETGGSFGMAPFIKTEAFQKMNIGFAMDEGMASAGEEYPVFYGERSIWQIRLKCRGTPGHGSLLLKNTAGEKMRIMIDRFMDLRKAEEKKLEDNPELTIGDVTTVNLTMISGGVQSNVVPPELSVMFDLRLAIDVDHGELLAQIESWCQEAGGGIEFEFEQKTDLVQPTKITPDNVYWNAFQSATKELGLEIRSQIFPGGTDIQLIRGIGIPAIGFSPMNKTPVLLHDHDEYLTAETYLKGVDIYRVIISKVANA